jgi:hypothetical protein
MPSLVSAQLMPQRPKVDRWRTKVTLKSLPPSRRWPIPKELKAVLPLLILQTLRWPSGTVSGEGPYRRRDAAALLIKQSPHQLMLVTRGASAMVAVPTGVPSARTVALVLAVLGYRRRLRRRDRWSRSALLAHQDRALRRLREHAYQKSRFYQDFHAGLASAPLSALPVLTKQMLMESFDSVVTRPGLRLADVEDYLATLRGNELFQGRYFVSATAGTTGSRGVFLWNFPEWVQSRLLQPGVRLGRLNRRPHSPSQDSRCRFHQSQSPIGSRGSLHSQSLGAYASHRFR